MTRPAAEESPRSEASAVPSHVERSAATIAELHTAHYREAGALQKAVSRVTGVLARPVALIVISMAITSWVTLNLALHAFGRVAPDPFPFPLLSAAVSTLGLYLAAMISDRPAPRRRACDPSQPVGARARAPQRAEIREDHCPFGRIPPQRPEPGRPSRRTGRGAGRTRRHASGARRDQGRARRCAAAARDRRKGSGRKCRSPLTGGSSL